MQETCMHFQLAAQFTACFDRLTPITEYTVTLLIN